jgi:hypothetical protein
VIDGPNYAHIATRMPDGGAAQGPGADRPEGDWIASSPGLGSCNARDLGRDPLPRVLPVVTGTLLAGWRRRHPVKQSRLWREPGSRPARAVGQGFDLASGRLRHRERRHMTIVVLEISMSLDGYVTAAGEALRLGLQRDRKECDPWRPAMAVLRGQAI